VEATKRLTIAPEHHDGFFDHNQSEVVLAHLMSYARYDHGQLRLFEIVKLMGVCFLGDFESLLESSQRALAVGFDGTVHVEAR